MDGLIYLIIYPLGNSYFSITSILMCIAQMIKGYFQSLKKQFGLLEELIFTLIVVIQMFNICKNLYGKNVKEVSMIIYQMMLIIGIMEDGLMRVLLVILYTQNSLVLIYDKILQIKTLKNIQILFYFFFFSFHFRTTILIFSFIFWNYGRKVSFNQNYLSLEEWYSVLEHVVVL